MYHLSIFVVLVCILTSCAQSSSTSPSAQPVTHGPSIQPPGATPALQSAVATSSPQTNTVRRPFPQHTTYTAGTIKPTGLQTELDKAVTTFYDDWKKQYLIKGCKEGRYYILKNDPGDKEKGIIGVSEGQGYGMVITALMASYDPQAQVYFDGLYTYFRDHPSAHSPDLMAWRQAIGCVNAKDSNTAATDADMDIAYALLLADAQWGSTGPINYKAEALKVIAAIKTHEVGPQYFQMLLGDWVASSPKHATGSRTSDWMFNHMRAYNAATGDATWNTIIDKTYDLVQSLQTSASPQTGLLPDFVQGVDTKPIPAAPGFLEGANDGAYGYNACRVPWRIATDYLLAGEPRALAAVRPINRWIRKATNDDPGLIYGGYKLDGTNTVNYSEIAFAAPLGVSAMVEADNQQWLDSIWKRMVNQSVSSGSYYNNILKLQAMIVMSGNWWSPVERMK